MDARALEGRTVAITGGTNGLGRAMAQAFARAGAHVVIGDLDPVPREGGEATDAAIRAAGGNATFVRTDVAVTADVDRLIDTAIAVSGRLDVLVTSAVRVYPHSKGLLETTEEDWDAMVSVNLRGVYLCCRRGIAQMVEQEPLHGDVRGRVILMASQFGFVGCPGHFTYSVEKGGIVNMTRQLAVDFGPRGVLVNCISPGKVPTSPHVEEDADLAYYTARTPFSRFGRPDEVAAAALYLGSDLCSYVSGAIIPVDGGWLAF